MTASHSFFADESGNAGINYLDGGQPFHVAAGFLIPNVKLAEAEAAIRAQFPRGEVKGKDLLQSPNGQRRALRLLESLGAHRAMPFYIGMERWFSIAGKLVDVFLDPGHQDAVDWLPTGDLTQREAVTGKLSELLPREVLVSFARAYRRPSVEPFREVLRATIERLDALEESQLAQGFRGALANLEYIVEQESYGDTPLEHAEWASLNLPAFMHLIRNVDVMMDGWGTYQMVHDRVAQFEAIFTKSVNTFSAPGKVDPDIWLDDGRRHRVFFRNLASFTMADSKSVPLLQAADILASSMRRILGEASLGWKNPTEEMQELFRLLIPFWFEQEGMPTTFGGIYASEKTTGALVSAVTQEFVMKRV